MLTKYASLESAEVLEVKSLPERARTANLDKFSEFNDYRTEDGYLYARIRAISSRVNRNHDGWPTAELAGGKEAWEKHAASRTSGEGFTITADKNSEYGFSTFLGKPNFVDHHNSDPKRARGVVVDAKFHVLDHKTASEDDYWREASDEEHLPASEVELLIEIDGKTFPKYAEAIVNGDLDGFSMGCDVDYSKCSHCGNEASSPNEYCSHVISKGAEHTASDGQMKKSYENCYGIKFFEISGVFDPADETALAREVRASVEKEAEAVFKSPEPHEVLALATKMVRDNPGSTVQEMIPLAEHEISSRFNIDINDVPGGDGAYTRNPMRTEYTALPKGQYVNPDSDSPWMNKNDPNYIRPQGATKMAIEGMGEIAGGLPLSERNIAVQDRCRELEAKGYDHATAWAMAVKEITGMAAPSYGPFNKLRPIQGSVKLAQPEPPQAEHTTAPEEVDTHRSERICPLCGSDMDADQCDVCGYEEPPEQLQNPDLTKAQDTDMMQDTLPDDQAQVEMPAEQPLSPPEPAPHGTAPQGTNPHMTSRVNNDMRWTPRISSAPKPSGDEPSETVTSDQTTPVTSAMRTARDLIAAAKNRNQENHMANEQHTAAEPVPAAKADKRVDVEGVGGVIDANNVDASKPEGPHSWEDEGTTVDVTGKGGIMQDSNAEASKPSAGTMSVEQTSDNAGFQPGGEKGPKTQTWKNTNEPSSAVTDRAVQAAKQGVKPNGGADVQPQRRENVEEENEVKPIPGTQQWTGTGGNGVTKMQNPVTNKPTQSGGVKASGLVSLAALKLADAEVALGLLPEGEKYNRLAELAETDDVEIEAEHRALAKVKTAGLTRTASQGGVSRLPSFKRIASEAPTAPVVDDDTLDAGLYR